MTVMLSVELREDRSGNRYLGAPVPTSVMAPWRQTFRAQVGEQRAALLEDHKRTRDGDVGSPPDPGSLPDVGPEHHITLVTPPELEQLSALPQQLRRQLDLGPHTLHVTLGFASQDIHHLPKDRSALVAAQPGSGAALSAQTTQAAPPEAPATSQAGPNSPALNSSVRVRISSGLGSLQPSEQRVARFALEEPERVVESTAQELADLIGVSRTTVVRTCRSLGCTGYPQFRVALAREAPAAGEPEQRETGLRAEARHIVEGLHHVFDAVRDDEAQQLVDRIARAHRVLVVANGQSAPCAMDLSLRLTAAGRSAEFLADALAQQVAVRLLGEQDLCLAISSSGVNDITLRTLQAARESAAHLMLITSQEESPAAELADSSLMLVPPPSSFLESLQELSRLHYTLAVEALAQQVRLRVGAAAQQAVDVLAENIID